MPPLRGLGNLGGGGQGNSSLQSNAPTAAPHGKKRDKFLQLLKPYSRSPSPNPPTSVSQQAAPHVTTTGSDDLWTQAYHKLPDDLKQHLAMNNHGVADRLQTLQDLLQTAVRAKETSMAKRMNLKWGDKEINVQETADKLVGWITKFKEIGDVAMQYDPIHAALPWAGVRFILLLVVGDQEKLAAAIVGMERVAVLIGRCAIYERLYLTGNVPASAKDATENLRKALLALYTAILQALCRLIRIFEGKIVDKLRTPESTLSEIRAIDEPENTVNSTAIAVGDCYHSATREYNKEEFYQLRELLNDFIPAISRINRNILRVDANTSRIDRNVDVIYKDIEENKRVAILKWFSTVPYKSHHDLACEDRVEHTGTWLFKRREFTSWENSKAPAILWLHGIPGAGKTKLVSATIEYLNSLPQFDKVAFFYCKRDEADRRDREKILLALIKQMACPPLGMARKRTGICTEALEAYDKEQEDDPGARKQLNFSASLKLLGHLVECFTHPVVVLDALDECSEEVRGHLLRGLLSVIKKAKCPFKVFISSRHNLDIETRLQNLPHVCIEARDNAEDIANYVQQELTLAIQDKRLLRGNVSQELRNCVEEVILRDANGMFLWADWQLRELCKLLRESDIRTRLGRLPKGLTGVYDEIINSIKSQPSCNFHLASNALKWLLVAERPLTPAELVAATELNPPRCITPHNFPGPSRESALAVELLIHSCGGLLLQDTQLGVVRFSHLSVQEYLETRNDVWGVSVIDAQLLVSESCLWMLQSTPRLPLYQYAAQYWFHHCRLYQDLVLSAKDTKHALCIPLLDGFLGSFEQASASYVKWSDWVGGNRRPYVIIGPLASTLSTPVCPAFSAAFAGLGELVSWLWNTQRSGVKIENCRGETLLGVASRCGTGWIVAEVLKWGPETEDVQNALYSASAAGKSVILKLLLDHGADINLPDSDCATALTTAVNYDAGLELVTFLLDRGADINLVDDNEGTPLGIAARKGNMETVILLLGRGAEVNATGGRYVTALGSAAHGGRLDMVTYLLGQGAEVNLTCDDDIREDFGYGTALSAAACSGVPEIVTLLLDRGAAVNLVGGEYGTALGAAAASGDQEIATLLLDRGADVNLVGGDYDTALGAAVLSRVLEIVTLLLDRGAHVNLTGGEYGYGSALVVSVCYGSLEVIILLLNRGAEVNLTGGRYGAALGAAAYSLKLDNVTLLLDRGADVNLTAGNYGTALGAVAAAPLYMGNSDLSLKIATLLLDRVADVNVTSGIYGTALGAAAYHGKLAIVTLLLDRGADVNITGGVCGTPLGAASCSGHLEIVSLLLDRGADVNLIGGNYGTALGAVGGGSQGPLEILVSLDPESDLEDIARSPEYADLFIRQLAIVPLLLERGADINMSFGGKYGTALGAAAYGGEVEMVKLLLDQGANRDLMNSEGARPYDLAVQQGRLDIVNLLDSSMNLSV